MPSSLTIYCDGGSRGNPGPSACAFVAIDEQGRVVHEQGFYLGSTTNNVAEYQAVIHALSWLNENLETLQHRNFEIFIFNLDSQLLYSQILGKFKIKAKHLQILMSQLQDLLKSLHTRGVGIQFQHQLRHHNQAADNLVNQTLDQN